LSHPQSVIWSSHVRIEQNIQLYAKSGTLFRYIYFFFDRSFKLNINGPSKKLNINGKTKENKINNRMIISCSVIKSMII